MLSFLQYNKKQDKILKITNKNVLTQYNKNGKINITETIYLKKTYFKYKLVKYKRKKCSNY